MRMLPLLLASLLTAPASYAAVEALRYDEGEVDSLFLAHFIEPEIPEPPVRTKPDHHPLRQAFTRAREAAITANVSLDGWLRQEHLVYVLEEMSPAELVKLGEVFDHLRVKVGRGVLNLPRLLDRAPHPLIVGRVTMINDEAARLKRQHRAVIRLAHAKHELEFGHTYGGKPYSYHWRAVRRVLKRFGFGPRDSFLGLLLGTAAPLHDLIEDTDVRRAALERLFGPVLARIVWGVTKVRKRPGLSKDARLRSSLARTAKLRATRVLKLADRVANVEEGLVRLFSGQPTKVHKYFLEWPVFREKLYREGEADAMWRHLECLLTDKAYARRFASRHARPCERLFD